MSFDMMDCPYYFSCSEARNLKAKLEIRRLENETLVSRLEGLEKGIEAIFLRNQERFGRLALPIYNAVMHEILESIRGNSGN